MRVKRFLVACVALLSAGAGMLGGARMVLAQTVQINIAPPPLNQLKVADLWRLQVLNVGRTDIPVYFFGTITEEEDGLIVDGTSASVVLRPGLNRFSGSQVEPVDIGYGDSRYERALIRTGGAPSGVYEICVQALHAETANLLGENCLTHEVSLLNPPILVSPTDGDVVTDLLPTFVWTPASGGRVLPRRSRITITGRYGRQSWLAAVGANPPWFEGEVFGTTFRYPAAAKRFTEGEYAWRVATIDPETGQDLATSDVGHFRWEPQQFVLVPVVLQKIPGIPNAITDELLAPCSGIGVEAVQKDIIVTRQGSGIMRLQLPGNLLQIDN